MMTTTCVVTIIVASRPPPPFVHWASGCWLSWPRTDTIAALREAARKGLGVLMWWVGDVVIRRSTSDGSRGGGQTSMVEVVVGLFLALFVVVEIVCCHGHF
jgi:hypothetical protein